MCHSRPAKPDRYLTYHDVGDRLLSASPKVIAANALMANGWSVCVHHRPCRNRYTLAGKPITRRVIDRLVYFGVLDEEEL